MLKPIAFKQPTEWLTAPWQNYSHLPGVNDFDDHHEYDHDHSLWLD